MDDGEPPRDRPLSRQSPCPNRECGHEHHLMHCDRCDCHVRDPFGVIPDD